MKATELSSGKCALVDDGDYEWLLIDGNWSAAKRRGRYYAVRNSPGNPRRQHYYVLRHHGVHSENEIPAGMFVTIWITTGLIIEIESQNRFAARERAEIPFTASTSLILCICVRRRSVKAEKTETNFAWLADDVHELIARESTLCLLAIT